MKIVNTDVDGDVIRVIAEDNEGDVISGVIHRRVANDAILTNAALEQLADDLVGKQVKRTSIGTPPEMADSGK